MSKVFVDDGRLSIELPDGFELMSSDLLQSIYGMEYMQMWGARDEGRHVAVTIIWKDSNALVSKLASQKALAKRVEKALAKAYRHKGYRVGNLFETNVAQRDTHGFAYACQIEGIPHECEVLVFKDGGRCYTLYYYAREECAQKNRSVYESMLASLSL
ncbi:MAG: hypothetical protein Q4A07_05190 [Coriobacteriales bacterium]|nr:hypothetical protein [Coriobacteriales bacterium]